MAMKTDLGRNLRAAKQIGRLVLVLAMFNSAQAQPAADPGWPRVFKKDNKQLTIYQPQVDSWKDHSKIHFRCAIAVKGVTKQERFGVAELDAVTVVDQADRIVVVVPTQRDLRFANTSASELAALRGVVNELHPPGQTMTISLDRVLAYLNLAQHPTQPPVEVNLDPPRIFCSRHPAILVMFLGEPQFKPVETNRTDLMFALNTNWDLFYDTVSQRYFLLDQNTWLSAHDVKGPWLPTQSLPGSFSTLPRNDNWAAVRQNIPPRPAQRVPAVFVSTQPAELILLQGEPKYSPIPGTQLLRIPNTESVLFLDLADSKFYFLVAGRWFRAPSPDGPWSAASKDLPADFARIPDSDPAAFVKASVPGTRQAQDAVLLASIPTTTLVYTTNVTVQVVYHGQPQFQPIETTTVQYAVNSPYAVFLVNGKYYCCDQGVWFISSTATGPWSYCTSVPPAIYTIPPSNPYYNVTYVVVQSSTPTTVVYSQTSGYSGQYVAATGVLMFGAGIAVGAIIANNSSHYCYPPPACYSYGCSATYHYGYGGYYSAAHACYGPYGGASYATAYNPSTGTYSRGAYAYGPYGSAGVKQAYNPYTGGYAQAAQVNTAYGSATRASGYNPSTGTAAAGRSVSTPYGTASRGVAYNAQTGARAAGSSVSTAYGSASRGAAYNPTTGNAAWGGSRSSAYGSASAVQTSSGASAASWDTANSQGKVAKTSPGNVYAANDGTVYKKDSNGSWSQNSASGWQRTAKATPYSSDSSSWSQQSKNMESQAQSRSWGNQQHESAQSWQSSGGSRSYGGSSSEWGGSRSSSSWSHSGGYSRGGRR
jgi:hypothetical protein